MPRFDEKDRSKMVELAAMGYSNSAIARRFGCSPTYVGDVLAGKMAERVEAKKASTSVQAGRRAPRWLNDLPTKVDLSGA